MMNDNDIFLIDSNALMQPYRFFYAFDLVPSYWDRLRGYLASGRIVILDIVKEEIEKGQDRLSKWMSEVDVLVIISKITEETIKYYGDVIQYIATSGYYKASAVTSWAQASVADPWIIASAKANGFTIVTQEVVSGGLSKKTPNKMAKIPDVARHFEINTIDIYEMMRSLEIRI